MTIPELSQDLWLALGASVIAVLFALDAIGGALTDNANRLVWGVYIALMAAFVAGVFGWLGGWRP
jgi:VIT1/CCC1 family predicted Fe2+/Mn2+ transporter